MNLILEKITNTLGLPRTIDIIDVIVSKQLECTGLKDHDGATDLSLIAEALGDVSIEYKDLPCDGLLVPGKSNQYQIIINMYRSAGRKRFTLAHELAHILINRILPETRDLKTRTGDHLVPSNADEEKLCDSIAARLLMPTVKVRKIVSESQKANADMLFSMVNTFEVSVSSAARRMQEFFKDDFAVFLIKSKMDERQFEGKVLKNFFQSPLKCNANRYYKVDADVIDIAKRSIVGWYGENSYRKRKLISTFSPVDDRWAKLLAVASR